MHDRTTRSLWFSLAAALVVGAAAATFANPPAPEPSPAADADVELLSPTEQHSSIWLISTRHLAGSENCELAPQDLDVRRYDETAGWGESDLSEFVDTGDPDTITLVYVHGNRFDWHDAIEHGWLAHNALVANGPTSPSVRYVIWSWPSARIRGLLRDVRLKAYRAHSEAYRLAWFLDQIGPQTQVSLIGSSYGARVITGALHLLGGGRLNGNHVPASVERRPARVVLMAAAVHNDWLLTGAYHGQALSQTDAMLVFYNPRDPVLRRYHFLDRCSRSRALGFTGLAGCDPLNVYSQLNVSCVIGRSHSERDYFCSPGLMAHARRYLLWEPMDGG